MLVLVVVAWAAWSTVRPVSGRIEVALASANATVTSAASGSQSATAADNESVDWTGKPLMALLYVLGTAVTFYIAFEVIRFGRFCRSCEAIKRLGGSVSGSPACDNPFLGYVFSSFVVDLSGTGVSDSNCPSLSAIPFLTKVRLGGTNVGRKTVEELSECRHLVAVDLTDTALERRQIGPLAKLKKLENLLID